MSSTEKKSWSRQEIQNMIENNNKWLERGIVAIYNRQTESEKDCMRTKEHNNKGFNGTDAPYMSYVAGWILKGNSLSGKHLDKSRNIMRKYSGQLTKIANGE